MKLAWSKEADQFIGRLPAGRPTAMFIIERTAGGWKMSGAFTPDGQDGTEYRRLEHAKDEAQRQINDWVSTFTNGWKEGQGDGR